MDARLEWNTDHADLALFGPDLATDEGLDTAVILSLFLDARADAGDGLADGEDPRGWWGDTFAEHAGDQTGSKLWLLGREKWLNSVALRAKDYAAAALAWLVDDGIAASVDVQTEMPEPGRLYLAIEIHRPTGGQPFNRRYQYVWSSADAVQ